MTRLHHFGLVFDGRCGVVSSWTENQNLIDKTMEFIGGVIKWLFHQSLFQLTFRLITRNGGAHFGPAIERGWIISIILVIRWNVWVIYGSEICTGEGG